MRSRTTSIVRSASAAARSAPAARISITRSGCARSSAARSRAGASSSATLSASRRLQATQPIPAVWQRISISSRPAGSVKNSCRAKTLHTCGLPGSSLRTRAGSVTAVRSRAHSSSGSATIRTVLSFDFDIFATPSSPRTRLPVPTSVSGSGKKSPKRAFQRRATSRDSSRCWRWSSPTGTKSAR